MSPVATADGYRRVNRGRSHSYQDANGNKVPGVTTLIDQGVPKPGLITWAAEEVAYWAADNRDRLADMKPRDIVKAALDAFKAGRRGALNRGTRIHDVAEQLMTGKPVEVPAELDAVAVTFLRFVEEWSVHPIAFEAVVLNRRRGYMGTADLICRLGSRYALIDYKTGRSGIWPETALQLAAYANAEVYVTAEGEYPMPSFEVVAGLWLQDDGYDLVPVNAGEETFRAFLYAAQVAAWRSKDRSEVVYEPIAPPSTEGV